jgi:hypothetical protein
LEKEKLMARGSYDGRKITYDELTSTGNYMEFCTEASDLGFAVGEWPERLNTSMGNGMQFKRTRACVDRRENELKYVVYEQICGCTTLIIFND